MVGGVTYLQNDGNMVFINSTFEKNLALRASLFQVFNSQNNLEISGGVIQNNGFQQSDKFADLQYYGYSNATASNSYLGQYYSEEFLAFLQSIQSEVAGYLGVDQFSQNNHI